MTNIKYWHTMPVQMPRLPTPKNDNEVRTAAKSLLKDLVAGGYRPAEIVALATELIGKVTTDVAARR